MKTLKLLLAGLLLSLAGFAQAVVPQVCTGEFFNPLSDTDWNNMFPITIAGVPIQGSAGNTTPVLMQAMPPVCVCPTVFGYPMVGVGITYWAPIYISEIEHRAGCLSSLGGMSVLSSYSNLGSEQSVADNNNTGDAVNRMQVHWYEYPVFAMLDILAQFECKNSPGFNLAFMTEIDPFWQDDAWGAIFSPEAVLFSGLTAMGSCAVDAVAADAGYPLDALFWCAGHWGNVYPLTGNSSHSGDPFAMNNQIQAKFIARNHRLGLQMQTIGPSAVCSSHPNPIWVKTQYRFNQVAPIARSGRAVVTGAEGRLFTYPPQTHAPTKEYTTNLIWQGQQCCMKGIP